MKDMLPAYAAGSLSGADRDRVRAHVAGCPRCRADLAGWQAIADAAPPGTSIPDPGQVVRAVLTRSAIEGSTGGLSRRRLRHLAALVLAEARLIRLAVPIASALVMALGVVLVLLQAATSGATAEDAVTAAFDAGGSAGLVLALIAPIIAAAGVAGTYRSRHDPVAELVAATPASSRLLLLVRITLVFGYDLALAVAASVVLTATDAAGTTSLNALVAAWLGPMALLSSVSLLIAVQFGPDVALGVAAGLWAIRVLSGSVLTRDAWPTRFVVDAWSTNTAVLVASAGLAAAAVILAGRVSGEPHHGRRATHPL